jgi:hypothetical protein
VANAGADQTVTSGGTVSLNGSNSSDPDGSIATYAWIKSGGTPIVTLSNANGAQASFTAPAVTTPTALTFQLTVTDNGGASANDTCIVTVQPAVAAPTNQPPVSNAGPDQTVAAGAGVKLSGGGTDTTGTIVSYSWQQTGGTPVTLSNTAVAQPTFSAPDATAPMALTFQLTVADDGGLSAIDTCIVNVNPAVAANDAPLANAGQDQQVGPGAQVGLDGTGSTDDGGMLTYAWTQLKGTPVTLSSTTDASPSFTAPTANAATALTFQLTVADDAGQKASDICIVNVSGADSTVATEAPFADAGLDQVVNAHDLITLDGSGSADVDGVIVSYQWKQTRGPAVTLSDPTAASPTFTAPARSRGARLGFRLMVADDKGLKSRDDVVVEVNGSSSQSAEQPVAAAGCQDLTVLPGQLVTLSGAGSTPANGAMTYSWKKVAGPRLKLSQRKGMETTFVAPLMGRDGGKITFMLTVRNGRQRATDTCTVQIQGMGL